MKRTTLSLAVAALCSNGAYAITPIGATTHRVVIGGATAIQTSTQNAVIDELCVAGTIDVFSGEDHWDVQCTIDPAFGAPGGTSVRFSKNNGGSAQGATAVEIAEPVEVLSASSTCVAAPTPVQSTPGGTSFGAWVCADDGAGNGAAEVLETVAPDWGVSDVEPKMFRGALSVLVGGLPVPFPANGQLDSRTTASLPFGVVATVSLYQALQAVQFPLASDCNPDPAGGTDDGSVTGSIAGNGIKDAYEAYATDSIQPVSFVGGVHVPETPDDKGYSDQPHRVGDTRACMPTVSLAEARSFLRGDFKDWTEFGTAGGSNLYASAAGKAWEPDPFTSSFVLCRRTQGSGTHATISSQILGTQCSKAESAMPAEGFLGNRIVFENTGSSNLGECLDDLEYGLSGAAANEQGFGVKAWAVGYQSLEKNPDLEEGYRFLKIDGQSPDMKNFVEGDYWIFGTTTVNRNDDDSNGAGEYINPVGIFSAVDQMFEVLVTTLSDPSSLIDINKGLAHPFGFGGFAGTAIAGVPTLPSFPFDPDPTPASPDLPLATLTHLNPDTGVVDTCYGPTTRAVGGTTISVSDEENAE